MKAITIIIAVLIQAGLINAQSLTDHFGMPNSSPAAPYNNVRFTGDDMPITEVLPTIVFASPTPLPSGIAWDGTVLWVCGYNEYRIFCVNPLTGDTIKTIPLNIQRPYGVAYIDSLLYVLDNDNKRVVTLNYGGTISDTINLLDFGNIIFPTGLHVCRDRIWFNDTKGSGAGFTGDSTMFIIDDLYGFPAYADFPSGIAYDGQNLWVTDNVSQSTAKISVSTFEMTERFRAPGGAYPNGLAWDGNGLWYINNSSDSIYYVPHTTTSSDITENSPDAFFYPNPANDIIYFSSPVSTTVCIYDFSGRVVKEENNISSIDISDLAIGAYFVKFSNEQQKLIISR